MNDYVCEAQIDTMKIGVSFLIKGQNYHKARLS